MKEELLLLLMSTFWNKRSTNAASRMRQTPLALVYCFQRLQHLIKGGSRYRLRKPKMIQKAKWKLTKDTLEYIFLVLYIKSLKLNIKEKVGPINDKLNLVVCL